MVTSNANFPTDLINVTDLLIERPSFSSDFGDPGTPATIVSGLSAVVERKRDVVTTVDDEEVTLLAEVRVPDFALDVKEKDLLTFTDAHGTLARAQAVIIERFDHPGLTHTAIKLGRRTAA